MLLVTPLYVFSKSTSIRPVTFQSDRLRAIKELPFCAFIFFESKSAVRLYVGIVMDQDDITEDNLRLLFRLISEKYPVHMISEKDHPMPLEAQVYTDLRIPGALANNEMVSVGGKSNTALNTKKKKAASGGAFYMRNETVELFRYSLNYPEDGMKTVILRGKE
jgi:hypothetical protein